MILFDRSIQAILEQHLFGSSVISEAESVNVDGVRYAKGCAVLLPDLAEGDYLFGEMRHIFILAGGFPHLCCQVLHVRYFNTHCRAYVVEKTDQFRLVTIPMLLDFHPLGIYHIHQSKMIVLKYLVPVGY